MNCPFCGAAAKIGLDGMPMSYCCGSEVMQDESIQQSEPCRELCQLREKKAKGLEWVKNGSCLFADSAAGEMIVMPENGKQLLLVRGKSKARFPKRDAAKAHAEELHQQAWRELLDKWSAK